MADARMNDAEFDELLSAAQVGAGWALESIYRDLAPAVAGYLRAQGSEQPEDLVSEVFLRVFRDLGSFSGTGPRFRSWVFSIAHARLVDERRRRARRPAIAPVGLEHAEARAAGDVEDDVMARLAAERVRALCSRLSPDQRDVLLLRLVGDLTVEQVAAALGKSIGATKALQRRGLAALHRQLVREGVPL
jgi:RNA polymerase sigma-70 factor (ECF subfamily)